MLTGKEAETLIRSVQSRRNTTQHRAGRGIGLASSYLHGIKGVSAEVVKAAESRLVYRDDGMDVVGGVSVSVEKTGEFRRKFGTTTSEQVLTGTPLAIMDFEGIVTTARKDRDGDRLSPQGAEMDKSMPLLWQHLPEQPVGRMVKLLAQNELEVRSHLAIADIPLGRDAATLVEFGALRLSHGFQPLEFEPSNEKDADAGWLVHKYAVMETSLVSVPSNVDSIITAFSREKLHCPMVKGWAKDIYDARPQQVTSGWQPPSITVNVNIDGQKVKSRVTKADGDEEDPAAALGLPGMGADDPGAAMTPPAAAEDEPAEDDEPEGPKDVLLTDIRELVDEAAKADGLPKEAAARLKVLSEMIGDVEKTVKDSAAAIRDHSSDQNLAGMFTAMDEMNAQVVEVLARVKEESVRIQGLSGAESAADTLGKLDEQIDMLIDALTLVSESSDPQEIEDAASDGDLDPAGPDVADGDVDPTPGDPNALPITPGMAPMRSARPRRKGGVFVEKPANTDPISPDVNPGVLRDDEYDYDSGVRVPPVNVLRLMAYNDDTGERLGPVWLDDWVVDLYRDDDDGIVQAGKWLSDDAIQRLAANGEINYSSNIYLEEQAEDPSDSTVADIAADAVENDVWPLHGLRDEPGLPGGSGSRPRRKPRGRPRPASTGRSFSVSVNVSDARGRRVGTFQISRDCLREHAAAIETGALVQAGSLLTERQARGLSVLPTDRVLVVLDESEVTRLFTKEPAVQETNRPHDVEREEAGGQKMVGVTCADCAKEFWVPKRQSGLNAVCPWCDNGGQRPEGEMGKDWVVGERENGLDSRDDGVVGSQKNDGTTEDLEPELEADDDFLPEFAGEMSAKEVGGSQRTCASCGTTWTVAAGDDGKCPSCKAQSSANSGTVTGPVAPTAPTPPKSRRAPDAKSERLASQLIGAIFVGKSISLPTLVALQEAVESAIDAESSAVLAAF